MISNDYSLLVHSSLLIGRIYSPIIQFKIVLFLEEYNPKNAILTFLSLFINSIKYSYPLIIFLIKSFFSNWYNVSIIFFKSFILFEAKKKKKHGRKLNRTKKKHFNSQN